MKRLYEGASVVTAIFFLVVVIGGFLLGTKSHHDKSKHNAKIEKKVEKAKREKDKQFYEQLPDFARDLEYNLKMNDPLWNYYDPDTDSFRPIPGDYNEDTPRRYDAL